MVHFITGSVGSGKSTKLLNIYKSMNSGDGFYNVRCFIDGQTIGQDIVHMSTGIRIPFSRIEGVLPANWDEGVRYMNYSFSKQGFQFVNNIIRIIEQNNMQAAYIDELGYLEIQREGLFTDFKRLLQLNIELYAVCRDKCLDSIMELFKITNFTVIKP